MRILAIAVAASASLACITDPEPLHSANGASLGAVVGDTLDGSCVASWNPTWRQGELANDWWVEYEIDDSTVTAAWLEVPGLGEVHLFPMWQKWLGPTAWPIPAGTQVVLHAQSTSGQTAQTLSFAYLVNLQPATDACGPGGTCEGGVCRTCVPEWQPLIREESGANEWWVEYRIDDPRVSSARLEVIGGGEVALSFAWDKWTGPSSARIPRGSAVRVRATDSEGRVAVTHEFAYLVTAEPQIDACAHPAETCVAQWEPFVQQGSGANEWWVEYRLYDPSVTTVFLEVIDGRFVPLSFLWNKWIGGSPERIARGTQVRVHARNTSDFIAVTRFFPYLLTTEPEIDTCAQDTTTDLDVTYISRNPRYPRYEVEYSPPGYNPHLRAGTESFERWPDPGELVTFTAHVTNKGQRTSSAYAIQWLIDDVPVELRRDAPLAPGAEVIFTLEWPWQDGHHTVRFELLSEAGDAPFSDTFPQNNALTIFTDAWTFAIKVWRSVYDLYDERVNVVGTRSFEDWLQFQVSEMNRLFAETRYPFIPNGLDLHIVIDDIQVVSDSLPDPGGNHFDPPDITRDGNWGFPSTSELLEHAEEVIDERDDVLMHEWGHQIGLFDVYQMDVQANEIFVSGPDGAYVAGTPLMPFIAFDVVHYNTVAPDLMGGGIPFVFHEYTAHALLLQTDWMGRGLPKRRGFFGDYLLNIPAENALLVRGAGAAPLAGATIEIFQMVDGQIFDVRKFVGATDASGRYQFPHVTTSEWSLFYGGPAEGLGVPNPWSTRFSEGPNVVGIGSVFVIRVTHGGAVAYRFLETTAFNLAYFNGATASAEYVIDTGL